MADEGRLMAGDILADLVARLRLDTKNFDHGMKGVNAQLGRVEQSTRRTSTAFAGLSKSFLAFAGAGAAGGLLKGSITAASDFNETASKASVIFGDSEKAVVDFAKTAATSIGQSNQAALEAAATFGNLFLGVGFGQEQAAKFSVSLVKLASDFASFHNAATPQVMQALSSAFIGEYDALQRFVPVINAAAVEQKGLALGLARTTKELDAQDKALATFELVMEGAGAAAGDFERTSGGLANQQRTLGSTFDDLQVSLGEKLVPAMTGFVKFLNDTAIPVFKEVRAGVEGMLGGDKPGLNWFEKGADVLFELAKELGDNDRSFTLSKEAEAALAESWKAAEREDNRRAAAAEKDKKAKAAAIQAALNLGKATTTAADSDKKATDAAERLTRAKHDLASANRRVQDAIFDLADAEEDLREAEFRQGVGSEEAIKAGRDVERAKLRIADAQEGVRRDTIDLAEANREAATAVSDGLAQVATAVHSVGDAVTKAADVSAKLIGPPAPATFAGDVPAVGARSLSDGAIRAAGLGPGAITIDTTGEVSRIVGAVSEANKTAAESISAGLTRVSDAVDNFAKAVGVPLEKIAGLQRDLGNVVGGQQAGGGNVYNIGPVHASNPLEAVAIMNRELDWSNRGRRIATRTE